MSRELQGLLEQAGKSGFTWWQFRDCDELAGLRRHPDTTDVAGSTDVLVLRHTDVAHAYRTPAGPLEDELAPTRVWWWYGGPTAQTIRALLTLPAPGTPGAPGTLMPIPAPTGVAGDLTPVRIRVPRWSTRPTRSAGSDERVRWA
jgi:hypothetical protein